MIYLKTKICPEGVPKVCRCGGSGEAAEAEEAAAEAAEAAAEAAKAAAI